MALVATRCTTRAATWDGDSAAASAFPDREEALFEAFFVTPVTKNERAKNWSSASKRISSRPASNRRYSSKLDQDTAAECASMFRRGSTWRSPAETALSLSSSHDQETPGYPWLWVTQGPPRSHHPTISGANEIQEVTKFIISNNFYGGWGGSTKLMFALLTQQPLVRIPTLSTFDIDFQAKCSG